MVLAVEKYGNTTYCDTGFLTLYIHSFFDHKTFDITIKPGTMGDNTRSLNHLRDQLFSMI